MVQHGLQSGFEASHDFLLGGVPASWAHSRARVYGNSLVTLAVID